MSSVTVLPENVSAASGNLQNLGSALRGANAAAASQTTAVAAPAADEVSSAVSAFLRTHGQEFQALSAEAAAFHDEFVNLLNGGAAQYVNTEVANARQTLVNALNAPARALLGHPVAESGQGAAGAAANVADAVTTDFQGSSFNFPVGPFDVSGSFGQASFLDGGFALTGNVGVALSTPFGSPVLASGNMISGIAGDGTYFGHILENWPLGSWVAVDATGTFFPLGFTSLAYNFDGLDISLPGTGFFGPLIPNVSWNPTP
ncbi:PE family protein [Mycobacterium sp.]|uniref:PE family protein n=1 Tax=Mycobacterium sp. TaxID=1785 RepID=UPI002CEC21CA|nr:PE family protein [Mycobacterium sp.]HTY33272.1 PE family protein [Mycobacterium sp.]